MVKPTVASNSGDTLTASNGDVRISLSIEIKAKYIAAFQQHEQHKRRVISNAVFKAIRAYPTIRIASQEADQDPYSDDSYVHIRTGSSTKMQGGKIVPSSDDWPSSDGPNIAKSPTGGPSMKHSNYTGEKEYHHDRRRNGLFLNRDKLTYYDGPDEDYAGFEEEGEEDDDDGLQPDPEDESDEGSDEDEDDDQDDDEDHKIVKQNRDIQPNRNQSNYAIARQTAQQSRITKKRSAPHDEDDMIRESSLQTIKKRKPLKDVTEQSKNITRAGESAPQDSLGKKRPSKSISLDDHRMAARRHDRSKERKVSGLESAKGKKR